MQNDDKFYRLVCESVDLIVLVKKLTIPQEKRLFKYVKKLVKDIEEPLSISRYEKYILSKTLAEPAEFFDKLPKEEKVASKIIHAVYETVLQVYPMLDINLLCSNLNHEGVLLSNLGDIFRFLEGAGGPSTEEEYEVELEEGGGKFSRARISSLEDIERAEKYFKRNIIGQEEAIDSIIRVMKVIASGLSTRAALFFVGPKGTVVTL
jgi:hypothetical protein